MDQYNCYKYHQCNAEFTEEEFKNCEGFCNKCFSILVRQPVTEKHIVENVSIPKMEKKCGSGSSSMNKKAFSESLKLEEDNVEVMSAHQIRRGE